MALFAPGFLTMAGIAAASTGASVGASMLLNKGGGINTKSIGNTMSQYLSQIQAAGAALKADVAKYGRQTEKKVAQFSNDLLDASDAETTAFWNNLGIFNQELINTASALVESYDGDVMRAVQALETNVNKLNESYAQDMGAEIERYGSVGEAINAQLAADKDIAETKFLDRVNQFQTEYRKDSLGEIDAAKAESMSLGDQFMQRAQGSLDRFDSFISSSPETLDALSKSVFQTRQQLLAEADPRALELSQIADNNAAAMMSGQISADMQANVARSSAMRALQGGFGASSEMGRGLTARDLGLTSLDLQQRGFDDFQRQRALNFQTRVAGVQETASGLYNSMLGGEESLMRNTIGTAESDRNQRLGAVQEASGQRLQTFDRLFGSSMGVADTLRGQDMTLAAQLSDNRRDDNIRSTGMRMGATQDIYNNTLGLVDTVFNTGVGLAGQKLSTGLSVAGDIYKTNIGGAGAVYDSRTGVYGNIFGAKTNTANNVMNAKVSAAIAAMNAEVAAMGGAAATNANIPIIDAASRQSNAMQSAQLWGSALQAGSSLAGSYLGSQNFSNMGSRSFGGGYGGGKNVTGWGNFDYGSGTGA